MTYYPELVRYAKRHFDESTAEDLVQQAFTNLLRFEGEDRKVRQARAYLYRALTGLMLLEHRRRYKRPKCQDIELGVVSFDLVAHLERVDQVRKAVQRMKPHLQAVALDVLLEGYSQKEAAERHNVTYRIAKWATKTARARIKKALANELV